MARSATERPTSITLMPRERSSARYFSRSACLTSAGSRFVMRFVCHSRNNSRGDCAREFKLLKRKTKASSAIVESFIEMGARRLLLLHCTALVRVIKLADLSTVHLCGILHLLLLKRYLNHMLRFLSHGKYSK